MSDATDALQTAIRHIEHMGAWITRQNDGYSFEGLGEDMPGIKAGVAEIERLDSDLTLCRAERDAAEDVSATARRYVAAMESKLKDQERELAGLIEKYYRREIGVLMHQAEHWAKENYPLAVHHRVCAADSYYQIVCLCERFTTFDENPFDKMREELARSTVYPPGTYPPTVEINSYRQPAFVVEKLKTAPREAGGPA